MAIEGNYQKTTFEIVTENNSSPKLDVERTKLVNETTLQGLSDEIRKCFPTFVGSIIADRHGFLLHSDLEDSMDDNMLALSMICKDRKLVDLSDYHQIMKPLSKNVQIMVILNKSRSNYINYGQFEKVVSEKNPI